MPNVEREERRYAALRFAAAAYFFSNFYMHYDTHVLIPATGDIQELVDLALQSFNQALEVEPNKVYLDRLEIQGMVNTYGTAQLTVLANKMEDWNGSIGGADERGLFWVSTFNPDGHWDSYVIGGGFDGCITGKPTKSDPYTNKPLENTVSARQLASASYLSDELPCCVLTPEGEWVGSPMPIGDWNPEAWDRQVREILERHADVVCVDLHR